MRKKAALLILFCVLSLSAETIVIETENPVPAISDSQSSYPKFRLMFDFGSGYQVYGPSDSLPSLIQEYEDKLRSGKTLRLEFAYFKRKSFGFGLHFSQFRTSNSIPNLTLFIDSTPIISGKVSDDVKMSLYGVSVCSRYRFLQNRLHLLGTFVFGLMTYDNEAVVFNKPQKGNSTTLGLNLSLGADFYIVKDIGIGFNVGYYRAHFTGIESNGATYQFNPNEGWANRVEASLGLRFSR